MKPFFILFLFSLCVVGLNAQIQGNSITANLVKLSETSIAVDFVVGPSADLSGTGNPISVLLRIPNAYLPNASTIALASSAVSLALAQAADDGNGFFIYYYQGPALDLSSPAWDNGVTTRVGVFNVVGSPGSIQLSGGQYGSTGAPNGSGGFTWSGTALLTNNTATNLVSWPISQSLTLPLQFTEFNLFRSGLSAQLQWTTFSEINTSHFEIQRSNNNLTWETLNQVAAAGHSSTKRNYTYQDPLRATQDKVSGTLYYRIKSIDQDQFFSYSAVKHIQVGSGPRVNLRNTLVRDRLVIQYQDLDERIIEFKIVDVQGRVHFVNKTTLNESSGTFELSQGINVLPIGVYHLISLNPIGKLSSIRFVKTGN